MYFLVSRGGGRPQVGRFVGRDRPFRDILFLLFPVVPRLVSFTQLLSRMLVKGEVWSSELKTSLSSSKQDNSFEVLSKKISFKALRVLCTIKGTDESRIKKRFQIPLVKIRIPGVSDRACSYFPNEACLYEADFISGLHFPIHPFIRELFHHLKLAPTQLVPNSWKMVVCCLVIWMSANERDILRVEEFLHLYHFRWSKLPSY